MTLHGRTSVLIPAYGEESAIGALVESIRAIGSWKEILVVDDGSKDRTAERAREAGATVIRHPYNKGNGAAVKTAVRAATGEFLLLLDADGLERLALFVAPRYDAEAARRAAAEACERALPRYKRPKWVRSVPELPRTATGKVQRYKLRELLERELAGKA